VFAHACQLGAERIVSKKVDSTYQSARAASGSTSHLASVAVQRERSERWDQVRCGLSPRQRNRRAGWSDGPEELAINCSERRFRFAFSNVRFDANASHLVGAAAQRHTACDIRCAGRVSIKPMFRDFLASDL
jgi:hypothetical protein